MHKELTILIPHYKTLMLTKLCLRLLRKHTDLEKVEVIVIDNDSQDESSAYLRTVSWITRLHRKAQPPENGTTAHERALNLALAQVTTPYVLSIHTDTLMLRHGWLPFLMQHIQETPGIAGVGSWKLEHKNWIERQAKTIEFFCQKQWYQWRGKTSHRLAGVGDNALFIRSHCALYDAAILRKHHLQFSSKETVGKQLHRDLESLGYQMRFIASSRLGQYMCHLDHATVLLNPMLADRHHELRRKTRRMYKLLAQIDTESVLADASLDD